MLVAVCLVRCVLSVGCCCSSLCVSCWLLAVVRWLLFVVSCLFVRWLLIVRGCLLFAFRCYCLLMCLCCVCVLWYDVPCSLFLFVALLCLMIVVRC